MIKNKNLRNIYNRIYKKGEEKHYTSFIVKGGPTGEAIEVLKSLSSWKGKRVLDVGCGTGYFAYLAAKKGAKVLGIDFSESAIDSARKTYSLPNLEYKNLDISKIIGEYDVVVSVGTLEHMDNPFNALRRMKKHLNPKGKIIVTCPNWTNPRGYVLMTLKHLFNIPITLADLHYLTPLDFVRWAKKLKMDLSWRTFDRSWGHGEVMIKDFRRRLPLIFKSAKIRIPHKNIDSLINWLENNVLAFNNDLPHSGALGIYIFSSKK